MRALAELVGAVVIFFAFYKGIMWMVMNVRTKDGVTKDTPKE